MVKNDLMLRRSSLCVKIEKKTLAFEIIVSFKNYINVIRCVHIQKRYYNYIIGICFDRLIHGKNGVEPQSCHHIPRKKGMNQMGSFIMGYKLKAAKYLINLRFYSV